MTDKTNAPGVNPARVYHDAKAKGSRPAVRSVLNRLAGWLLGLDRAATWEETTALPWWEVRARHVSLLRARLVEAGAARTTNRDLSLLRSVLTVAWENEQMPLEAYQRAVHVKGVDKDKTKAGRALKVEELRELMKTCEEMPEREGVRAAAILATMYGAGLRRVEIARGVLYESVDVETGEIRVLGKRSKIRKAYMAPGWVRYLRSWRVLRGDAPGAFFELTSPESVARVIEEVRERAGVAHFTPHDLRRSFGTHLLSDNRDLGLVKELMGHDDVRTTLLYDRRGEVEMREAITSLPGPLAIEDEDERERLARLFVNGRTPPRSSYDVKVVFAHRAHFAAWVPATTQASRDNIHAGNVTVGQGKLPERAYDATYLHRFSGKEDHQQLCAQAADWVAARRLRPSIERRHLVYAGGIADVADISGRMFVECGNTQVRKVLTALAQRQPVLVVPYLNTIPTVGFLFAAQRKLVWAAKLSDPVARGASGSIK